MKELKMFIDGRFIENESGKWIKVLNPSTEEVISLMPDGTVEDARKAIDAAKPKDSPMLKFFLPQIIWITWQAGPVGTKGKSFPVTALMKAFSYLRDRLE